jgi:hypothetical protein
MNRHTLCKISFSAYFVAPSDVCYAKNHFQATKYLSFQSPLKEFFAPSLQGIDRAISPFI